MTTFYSPTRALLIMLRNRWRDRRERKTTARMKSG
jgi:hypothetical protein